MASVLSSSAMFVQHEVEEALEIIASSKKHGLFVHFLNRVCFLGSKTHSQLAAYFFPVGSEFTASGQVALGSEEWTLKVLKVRVL